MEATDPKEVEETREAGEKEDMSEIKVTVNRFDSFSIDVDETDAVSSRPPGDETDAKKIKEFFTKHHEEPEREDEALEPAEKVLSPEEVELVGLVKIGPEDVYPSGGGLCLVIENDMFHTGLGLSKRKGSSVDRVLAVTTFRRLGCEVRLHQNLSCKEIEGVLEAAGGEEHRARRMLVVVILSHGNEGILYGYDGAYPAHKVWQAFTPDRCPSLAGKPKLFFIQACQGSGMDRGVEVPRTSSDSFASYRTPLHADFLLAHSTVAGYYSWRNTASGSWFIQVLGWALQANHETHDLLTILTKVTKVVAREYESNSSRAEYNHKKQTPFVYSTLTHKLYLQPK